MSLVESNSIPFSPSTSPSALTPVQKYANVKYSSKVKYYFKIRLPEIGIARGAQISIRRTENKHYSLTVETYIINRQVKFLDPLIKALDDKELIFLNDQLEDFMGANLSFLNAKERQDNEARDTARVEMQQIQRLSIKDGQEKAAVTLYNSSASSEDVKETLIILWGMYQDHYGWK